MLISYVNIILISNIYVILDKLENFCTFETSMV